MIIHANSTVNQIHLYCNIIDSIDIQLIINLCQRGFGFVTYVNPADSDKALEHLNGATVDGRIIRVERAKRSRGYAKTPGQCTKSAVTSVLLST